MSDAEPWRLCGDMLLNDGEIRIALIQAAAADQLGLVPHRRLAAAVADWMSEPEGSFLKQLVEQEQLDPTAVNRVSKFVQERLARYHHDRVACLESLENEFPLIRVMTSGQLSKQPHPHPSSNDGSMEQASLQEDNSLASLATQHYDAAEHGAFDRQFELLYQHAKGGLGEVLVANDVLLNRRVAIKRILDWHADDDGSRTRFLLEAQLTGRLEHPGIVPVYGMGTDDRGRPFYAMRFIKGQTLKQAIKALHQGRKSVYHQDNRFELRRLLGCFVDVCHAIGYAHSRGVIHRDIKPSNVIVGRFGETLVVDWGLAKIIGVDRQNDETCDTQIVVRDGDSGSNTSMGSALGTPGFMSPEQASGKIDDLCPASDIFSLGATLYVLLTQKIPYSKKQLSDVAAGDIVGTIRSPREGMPKLPKPLASICMKAMKDDPSGRYATASDLALEIERWLADESVQSHSESVVELAYRSFRRYRSSILVGSVLLSLLAFGMTGATIVIANKNLALQRANSDALKNEQKAIQEAVRAKDSAQVAGDIASQAMRFANEHLAEVPAKTQERYAMVVRSNRTFRHLLQLNSDSPQFQKYLADGLLVEASFFTRTTKHEKARSLYFEAVDLFKKAQSTSDDEACQIDCDRDLLLANIHCADHLMRHGEIKAAHQICRDAGSLVQQLEQSPTADSRRLLAMHLHLQAKVHLKSYQLDAAMSSIEDAVSKWLALLNEGDTAATPDLVVKSLLTKQTIAKEIGDHSAREAAIEQALAVTKRHMDASRRDTQTRLALVLQAKGELMLDREPTNTDCVSVLDQSKEMFDELFRRYPKYPSYDTESCRTVALLARSYLCRNQLDQAQELLDDAQRRSAIILEENESLATQKTRIDVLKQSARLAMRQGRLNHARMHVELAITIQAKIVENQPECQLEVPVLEELQAALDRIPPATPNVDSS